MKKALFYVPITLKKKQSMQRTSHEDWRDYDVEILDVNTLFLRASLLE